MMNNAKWHGADCEEISVTEFSKYIKNSYKLSGIFPIYDSLISLNGRNSFKLE